MDTMKLLYDTIKFRKENFEEGSYTCYLFDKGLDKILKKVGEECAETIISAKNQDEKELVGEICDLIYHLLVLAVEKNVDIDKIDEELIIRHQKQHNLKVMKSVDKNS